MLDKHIAPYNFGIMPYIDIFNLHISTYSIFIVLAFISAFICYKITATKIDKEKSSLRTLIIVFALIGGILGAKLPVIIFNFNLLFKYPENINLIFSGKTIIGGLIGGFLAVYILKRNLNINIKTGNDIAAPAALGMAIGRLGCFFGGCCYGIQSPKLLGVNFGDGIYRYPTQLYDSEKAIDAVITSIEGALKSGDKVQLVGFGTFEVKERAARIGRNPQSGAAIDIAASKTPSFKVGKAFKDALSK